MSNTFGLMIESLVALLLLLTIGYCFILNNRLRRLKADELALKATISELITATEMAERLHLPFELLSDEKLQFAKQLKLPTFQVDGMTLIKRITLVSRDGSIERVFYPVFPPDRNAGDVLDWLASVRGDELRAISDED